MERNIHRNVKLLTWFNFFCDFRFYAPVAIIYFSRISGSYALGLSIFSIEMISSSVFELPTGILSDFIGRKKTVVLGAFAGVASLILYALGFNFWFLAVGSILAGLSRSFYSGNNDALLHESLQEYNQEKNYAEYSGKTSSMFQFALAGSAFMGSLIAFRSFFWVMWLSVIPQIICVVLSLKMIEPKVKEREGITNVYSHLKEAFFYFKNNYSLRLLSISSIISWGVGETLYQFESVFIATLWPIWAIGISKMSSNIFAAIGMRKGNKIFQKLGIYKSIIYSGIYSRTVGIIAAAVPTIVSPLLMASASFPYGINSIATNTLFQEHFNNKQRATMGSLNGLFGNLFFGIFALAFGYMADKLNPRQALIIGEMLLIPIIFIYLRLFRISSGKDKILVDEVSKSPIS